MKSTYKKPIWLIASVFGVVLITFLFGFKMQTKGSSANSKAPYIIVLGIAQDGGFPQAGCNKDCCKKAWTDFRLRRKVVCLGLVDPTSGKKWLFEATPDFKEQLRMLQQTGAPDSSNNSGISGIFLTHGHIGHYTGLMDLGREVMDADTVPVYAMPRMQKFLSTNGPWSQLVSMKNIVIEPIQNDSVIHLTNDLSVKPFLVPHRDEYTETVGFEIIGPDKKLVFIPDINKWEKWNVSIVDMVNSVDYAFLDATFFKDGEIKKEMKDVPHPFVVESMRLFNSLSDEQRRKINFIHFNHTNPLLQENSHERAEVEKAGFNIAEEGQKIDL
jgi:pyrroloquinoline quinone biosynthesis protein B